MTVGSLPLFFLLMKRPYGFQAASAIVYTIFAVFFTFARTGTRTGKDIPPYMFTCPAVQASILSMSRRPSGWCRGPGERPVLRVGLRNVDAECNNGARVTLMWVNHRLHYKPEVLNFGFNYDSIS
jgi:hypothetical protein